VIGCEVCIGKPGRVAPSSKPRPSREFQGICAPRLVGASVYGQEIIAEHGRTATAQADRPPRNHTIELPHFIRNGAEGLPLFRQIKFPSLAASHDWTASMKGWVFCSPTVDLSTRPLPLSEERTISPVSQFGSAPTPRVWIIKCLCIVVDSSYWCRSFCVLERPTSHR